MSVKALRLRNFRGFSNAALELKPLTVLLGPNSSGKSSFSHPLAALAYCQRHYSGRRDANLTPENVQKAEEWPIDLGGYDDLVTHGCKDKVYVDLLTSEGWVEYGFGLDSTGPLLLSHIAYPSDVDVSSSSSIAVAVPHEVNQISIPTGDSAVSVERGTNISIPSVDHTRLILERINEQQWSHQGKNAILGLDGLIPLALQHASGTEIKFNRKSITETKSLLEETVYLRANRERPKRGYSRYRSEQKFLGFAGEKSASVLLNRGEQKAQFMFPPPDVSTIAKGDLRITWEDRELPLLEAVSNWLRHLRLADHVKVMESQRYGTEYVDIRVSLRPEGFSRDITEVGFALSQVLPVIVASLLQPKKGLFIVDLPEGHLHPRPQADLADLFCSLAMSGKSVLVETHSEMFFHRLRLRAAMDSELMSRIAVYFVDAPNEKGECRQPRKVGLGFEDELEWPAGFLREALDSEIQIDTARHAKR